MIALAMNTLWFWFEEKSRRLFHGTPEDAMRKYRLLESTNCLSDGVEIYLQPLLLKKSKPFKPLFYRAYSKLSFKSIHIGDTDPNFLDTDEAYDGLIRLRDILQDCEADQIIIHAHHFETNRFNRRKIITSALDGIHILVENNGFDSPWGGSVAGMETIFLDCPEFNFCLDLAHIYDFPGFKLEHFARNSLFLSRLKEIHFSYTTSQFPYDPYEKKGFFGYGPFHALFSVLDITPSPQTLDFVKQFPVVIEGIVPTEDSNLDFLRNEMRLLQ